MWGGGGGGGGGGGLSTKGLERGKGIFVRSAWAYQRQTTDYVHVCD